MSSRRPELNLIRRAIRERWKVPKAMRDLLPLEMERVVLNATDERSRVAAFRALLECSKVNLAAARLALDHLASEQAEDIKELLSGDNGGPGPAVAPGGGGQGAGVAPVPKPDALPQ